jgi:drug/metabolite transporter (DMT)-like permease
VPVPSLALAVGPRSSSIGLAVVFAVLGAAVLHAGWNAAAHAVHDRIAAFAVMGLTYVVVSSALLLLSAPPAPAARPYVAISAALHVAYTFLLARSYRLADFGQAYPLARGTSPWVVAIVAAVVVGERVTPLHLLGILLITGGLAVLGLGGGLRREHLPAIGAALLTGVVIAAYTVMDGLGVRVADSTLGYIGWLFLLQGLVFPLLVLRARRGHLHLPESGQLAVAVGCGLLSLVAYGVVIWAQTRAPLATVAALRETSIVFGALIGAVVFHERLGRVRVLGAGLAICGVLLLA